MFQKEILVIVLGFFSLTSSIVLADSDLDLAKADLQCNINKSESLHLFVKEGKVVYTFFNRDEIALEMNSFKVYRCPSCYRFEGSTPEHTYVGATRGTFVEETRKYAVNATISIDGKKDFTVFCFDPKAN